MYDCWVTSGLEIVNSMGGLKRHSPIPPQLIHVNVQMRSVQKMQVMMNKKKTKMKQRRRKVQRKMMMMRRRGY